MSIRQFLCILLHLKLDRPHIAVLLFTRTALQDSLSKKVIPRNYSRNEDLFQLLNKKAYQTASSIGLPVYVYDSSRQRGRNFGERIKNAFQEMFDRGYERVICLGNDSPELEKKHLTELLDALNTKEFAFGKTDQGGTYCMGISQKAFELMDWNSLPWQTRFIAQQLLEAAGNQGINCSQLSEILPEINRSKDFVPFLKRIQQQVGWFKQELFKLIFTAKQAFWGRNMLPILHTGVLQDALRGPPIGC
ncbi:MAG: DUF2064 domain-containing protein [Bacteroidetes bacterium]|nr:MAG: DUF2064 domain-containing protein [Bacteroidota bacterium]